MPELIRSLLKSESPIKALYLYRKIITICLLFDVLSLLKTKSLLMSLSDPQWLNEFHQGHSPWHALSFQSTSVLFVLLCSSLILLWLGFLPRLMALLSLLLHAQLIASFPFLQGVSYSMASYLLIPLILGQSLLKKENENSNFENQLAVALLKIQICQIYIYALLMKVMTPSWASGDALQIIFTARSYGTSLSIFMAHFPTLLSIGSFLTLVFLLLFPFLIWIKEMRIPMLCWGVFFHSANALVLGIPFFSLIFISHYLVFLSSSELDRYVDWFQFPSRKLKALG